MVHLIKERPGNKKFVRSNGILNRSKLILNHLWGNEQYMSNLKFEIK